MKKRIKYLIISLLTISMVMQANALVIFDMGGGVFYLCPDDDGDAAWLESECIMIIADESREEDYSSGVPGIIAETSTGVTIFVVPTGGTTTPTNDLTDNQTIDPPEPTDLQDPGEPLLPPVCRCNVCPDCGGCILEEGENLPVGCEDVCKCPPPCPCCENKNCERTCQVVASTTLVNPPNSSKNFCFNGGQKVIINVQNNSILGVTVSVSDLQIGGESLGRIIMPYQSFSISASIFGETPIWWCFLIETASDAACLSILANSCY